MNSAHQLGEMQQECSGRNLCLGVLKLAFAGFLNAARD
jgi:hypothetical protein